MDDEEVEIESGRYFIYTHPEYGHSVRYVVESDPVIPAAIIAFSDGVGGYVNLPFDGPDDFEAFKGLMEEFLDAGTRLFENYLKEQESE